MPTKLLLKDLLLIGFGMVNDNRGLNKLFAFGSMRDSTSVESVEGKVSWATKTKAFTVSNNENKNFAFWNRLFRIDFFFR